MNKKIYKNAAYFKIKRIYRRGVSFLTGYLNLSNDDSFVIITNKDLGYKGFAEARLTIPYKSILSFLLLWVYRKGCKYVSENLGSKNFPQYKEQFLDLSK